MNERIKEIAVQAGDDWDHTLESDRQFLQKFAELIIRECAELARQHNLAKAERSYMIHEAINQHFGVE